MTRSVKPYLVAEPSSVIFGGWRLSTDGEWSQLGEFLSDWDYNTDLRLRGELRVDRDAVLSSTGLGGEADLRLSASWRSIDGRVGATAFIRDLPLDEVTLIEVELPGEQLGPEVDLALRLVLGRDLEAGTPGVARLAGSVLWEDVVRLALVGTAARFPAVVLDFASCGLDPDASWVLELPDDLSTPVLGGLLLLLNSRDEELVAAVSGRTKASDSTARQLREQVAVQLLDHAVAHAEELLRDQWDEESLASTLLTIGRRIDGGLSRLSELRESHQTAYRAALVGEVRRHASRTVPA